jgi:hypothetical protein
MSTEARFFPAILGNGIVKLRNRGSIDEDEDVYLSTIEEESV